MTDIRMALREASELTGIPSNTLRSRYKVGTLKGERDNSGRLFVWIDPVAVASKKATSHNAKPARNDGELEALKAHIETLKEQLAAADARADEWQAKAEAAQAEQLRLWRDFVGRLNSYQPEGSRSWWRRIFD